MVWGVSVIKEDPDIPLNKTSASFSIAGCFTDSPDFLDVDFSQTTRE
jgi:hypothetical protein